MKASEFNRLVHRFIEGVTVPETMSHGSGVLVAGVMTARHIRRKVVFITGLDNASFPLNHDTFTLHSPHRGRIIREHRESEEGLLFFMAGAGAERLYFTFPGIDDEGNEASMSPYLMEIRDGIDSWRKPEFHHGIPGAAW